MPKCLRAISLAIAFVLAQVSLASAQEKFILVASTTSTEDSGLFGFILPLFKQKTGIVGGNEIVVAAEPLGDVFEERLVGLAGIGRRWLEWPDREAQLFLGNAIGWTSNQTSER